MPLDFFHHCTIVSIAIKLQIAIRYHLATILQTAIKSLPEFCQVATIFLSDCYHISTRFFQIWYHILPDFYQILPDFYQILPDFYQILPDFYLILPDFYQMLPVFCHILTRLLYFTRFLSYFTRLLYFTGFATRYLSVFYR